MGLLLGGALTEYLSWRWTLYVNLIFAAVAFAGGALLLQRQPSQSKPRLEHPRRAAGLRRGVLPGLRVLQRGRAQLARAVHLGVPGRRVALGVLFAVWQVRAAHPLLPPRVVLTATGAAPTCPRRSPRPGCSGSSVLTYYLQQTLSYSPLVTGVAFLPLSAGLILAANLSTIVLMPRFGPKPLVASGTLATAGAMAWLAQPGPHTAYAGGVLGPTILAGIGVGLVIAPAINTGTFGVAPQDAGVASATVTVGQQLGASIGTSLLNTIFAAAVASYVAAHLASARIIGRQALTGLALAHGYDTAFCGPPASSPPVRSSAAPCSAPDRWSSGPPRPPPAPRRPRPQPRWAPLARHDPGRPGPHRLHRNGAAARLLDSNQEIERNSRVRLCPSAIRHSSPLQNALPRSERKKRYGNRTHGPFGRKEILKLRTAGDRRS